MTTEVLFAGVPVADLAVAVGWYEKLFGRAADIVPNDNEAMWRVAERGWLSLVGDPERAGRSLVTISVSDLDAFVAALAARAIRTTPIEDVGQAGRKASVEDPDGNLVSVIEVA